MTVQRERERKRERTNVYEEPADSDRLSYDDDCWPARVYLSVAFEEHQYKNKLFVRILKLLIKFPVKIYKKRLIGIGLFCIIK